MKLKITLMGRGGTLATETIDVRDDDMAEVSEQIFDVIEEWVLGPGDTISIVEVDP